MCIVVHSFSYQLLVSQPQSQILLKDYEDESVNSSQHMHMRIQAVYMEHVHDPFRRPLSLLPDKQVLFGLLSRKILPSLQLVAVSYLLG